MRLYEIVTTPSQAWLDAHQTDECAPTWNDVIDLELAHIGLLPAPEAERAVRFTAWLRDYMPIGEKTLVALRGKGFVYLAAWLVSLNEQFALAEAEGGGGTDGLAD